MAVSPLILTWHEFTVAMAAGSHAIWYWRRAAARIVRAGDAVWTDSPGDTGLLVGWWVGAKEEEGASGAVLGRGGTGVISAGLVVGVKAWKEWVRNGQEWVSHGWIVLAGSRVTVTSLQQQGPRGHAPRSLNPLSFIHLPSEVATCKSVPSVKPLSGSSLA